LNDAERKGAHRGECMELDCRRRVEKRLEGHGRSPWGMGCNPRYHSRGFHIINAKIAITPMNRG
jgi:hypothetical protein